MLDPIGVNLRSRRRSSRGFFAVRAVFSAVLMLPDLAFHEAIGPRDVERGCGVLYVLMQEKLC